ncbi:hypothetical protein ACOSP7_028857 [Xanthoceras sorbifolium]
MDPEELSRRCSKMSLSEDDGPVATVGADLQDVGRRRLSLSLIGKIVGNREVNKDAFKATISSIWRMTKGMDIEILGGNLFVFRFNCELDRKRVLEGGPWTFDKQLIVLREATGMGRISEIDFSWSPFWIQLHNLPLVCMSKEVGLRVMVGLDKPLKRGLRVALGVGEELCSVLIYVLQDLRVQRQKKWKRRAHEKGDTNINIDGDAGLRKRFLKEDENDGGLRKRGKCSVLSCDDLSSDLSAATGH